MEDNSRTKNSILNINYSIVSQLFKIIFSFLSRTIFIYILGKEILGINGVYTSILNYLALSELGIGSAVIFTLYKPIANNNIKKIISIICFYRNVYKIIGIVILGAGFCIIPFLQKIVSDYPLTVNLYIAYIIYVINIASSYLLFSYRQVLLIVSQKKYIIEKTNIFYYFITNCIQITLLFLFHNYIIYLLIQFLSQITQQFWIYKIVGKEYPYLDNIKQAILSDTDKKIIGKNIFSISLFKIGAVVLNSTDNIIISAFIGVSVVGIYSNYRLLISTVAGLINLIFSSLTASIGNLNVSADNKKTEHIFNQIFITSTLLYGAAGMMLFQMLNPFISLWLGKSFIFSDITVIIFVIDFILAGYMTPVDIFKDACGIFRVGRYRPILTVIINIIMSIILVQTLGISGVVLATSISRICTTFWIDSKYIYKLIFTKKPYSYYFTFGIYILFDFIGIGILIFIRIQLATFTLNPIVNFFVTFIYTALFIVLYVLVVYGKKNEFIELKNLALRMLKKRHQ